MDPCESNGWSIVTSAPSNSAFAGVLAGFLFTGLVFLFQVPLSNTYAPGGKDWKDVHAPVMALFSVTFLDLGFDSYLFSRVAGFSSDAAGKNNHTMESLCNGVWMEAMAASGMLAVGAVALGIGLGYLLVAYDAKSMNLEGLARMIGGCVVFGVPLLLLCTSFNFYEAIWKWNQPNWAALGTTFSGYAVAAVAGSCFYLSSRRGKCSREKFVQCSTYGVAGYAVLGPAFAAVVVRFPQDDLAAPACWVVFCTIVISLVIPAVLSAFLAGGAAN